MKKMSFVVSILAVATLSMPCGTSVFAAVLCQKRSGIVVVRDTCKKKETPLELAQFGAVGPKGDQGDPGPAGSIEGAPAGGDLSGSYPAPMIAAAPAPTAVAANPRQATDPCEGPTPQSGIYCGISSQFWRAGAFADDNGLEFWRDRLGAIHVRGTARISASDVGAMPLFFLPVGARPAKVNIFPIGIGGGGAEAGGVAFLFVNPDGGLRVGNESIPGQDRVSLGEIQFRPDA